MPPKLLDRIRKIEARSDVELTAIHEGVRLYLKNLKAATGTAIGIGEHDIATAWREKAEHLEQGLMARLHEEYSDGVGPMPLAEAGGG